MTVKMLTREEEPEQLPQRSTQDDVDKLIKLYAKLNKQSDLLDIQKEQCRAKARKLLAETSETKLCGSRHGMIQWVQPSIYNSYDKSALDTLCQHDENLNELLRPHRKEITRSGYIKIST